MEDDLILKNINANQDHFEAIKDSPAYRMLLLALKFEVQGKRRKDMKNLPDLVNNEDWVFEGMKKTKEMVTHFASYIRPIEARKGQKSNKKPTAK